MSRAQIEPWKTLRIVMRGFSTFTSVGSPELQSFIGGCLRQQRTKVPPRVGGGSSETANNRQNLVGESEATW